MTELEFLKEKVKLLERIAELEREVANLKANPPIQYVPYYPTYPPYPTWPGPYVTWSTGTNPLGATTTTSSCVDDGKTQFSWTKT